MANDVVVGLVFAIRHPLIANQEEGLSAYLLRLSPALATLCLLLGIKAIPQFMHHIAAGVPTGVLTHLWAIGRYLFAYFTLGAAILLVLYWQSLKTGG